MQGQSSPLRKAGALTTLLAFALLMMLQLAACAADSGTGTPAQGDQVEETPLLETEPAEAESPEATPAPVEEAPASAQPAAEPSEPATPPGERVPPTEAPAQPVTGEVPEALLSAMMNDLAGRLSVEEAAIQVVEAAALVWPDGSLGCPRPGQNYTMALVNGYRVVLASGDNHYPYHAAETGYFLLCENTMPLRPPPGGTPAG